jgi:uncharacterized membrane protein YraQ (UPF0718 family)
VLLPGTLTHNWPFALAFFSASIILGLLSGLAAGLLESRGWLANQARYSTPERKTKKEPVLPDYSRNVILKNLSFAASMGNLPAGALSVEACGCASAPVQRSKPSCSCDATPVQPEIEPCTCGESSSRQEKSQVTPRIFLAEMLTSGKRLLFMFLGFAFIGYFLNGLIPAASVAAVFGHGNVYSVPLAATLGLPLYIGAALAFLITGAGTSIGAVAGALTIARLRVIALVIGTLWVGAVVLGFVHDFILTLGLF